MRELTLDEMTSANGGLPFVAPLVVWLYSPVTLTATGLSSSIAIGTGLGVIVGGVMAAFGN